ncbi:MAG: tetratricopeptide repeat protein [Pseudomonadota bacterium]
MCATAHAYNHCHDGCGNAGHAGSAGASANAGSEQRAGIVTGAGTWALMQSGARRFRRAAELHPASDAALNNLAQVLADQGRLAEAEAAAHRALALRGPNSVVAAQTLRDIQDKSEPSRP